MKPGLLGPEQDDTAVDRLALLTASIPWKTNHIGHYCNSYTHLRIDKVLRLVTVPIHSIGFKVCLNVLYLS